MIYFYAFLVSWLLVGLLTMWAFYYKQVNYFIFYYFITESIMGAILGYVTWFLTMRGEINRIRLKKWMF